MIRNVRVRLSNRTAVISCSDATYALLQDYWSYAPKGLWFMPKYKPYRMINGQLTANRKALEKLIADGGKASRIQWYEEKIAEQEEVLTGLWDGKVKFLKRNVMPAGLFRATWKQAAVDLAKSGVQFNIHYERDVVEHRAGIPYPDDPQYRHQEECVSKMLSATHNGGGLILAATGSGKTAMAALYFSRIRAKCLFVVDQLDLLYQQQTELSSWLKEDVGVVGDSLYDIQRVTVATIQTLDLHMTDDKFRAWYDGVDVVIIDELHEQMARRNFDVLQAIEPIAVFGLTATLQMTQKETRFKAFAVAGPILFEFPLQKGIDRGVLNPVKVLQLLFPEIETGRVEHHLDDIMIQVVENEEKHTACQAIVNLLHQYDRYVIVLTNRVKQLKTIRKLFPAVTRRSAYGAIGTDKRKSAIDQFEDGKIKLLIANKVFKKGVNIKRVDTMIDMAEMRSKNDAAQKLGRVVRLHDDKGMALYIDIGTQDGRYAIAATSRRRTFRKLGIMTKMVKVRNAEEAVVAVRKFLKKEVLNEPERSGRLFD